MNGGAIQPAASDVGMVRFANLDRSHEALLRPSKGTNGCGPHGLPATMKAVARAWVEDIVTMVL